MKTMITAGSLAVLLFAATSASATPSYCDSVAGNIVQNCGFEGGVHTSGGDGQVPNDWTSNAAFDSEPGFNRVVGYANSGSYGLSIGNYDYEDLAGLSQTLTDTSGVTYKGSVWIDYGGGIGGDPGAFLKILIGSSNTVLSLDDSAPDAWTKYSFSFVGTGSDLLTLEATTNPSEWYVDDFVIVGANPVPEPATLLLLGSGLFASGALARRRRRKPSPA
jgi:hypothetical protein